MGNNRADNIRAKEDDEIVDFLSTSPGHSHEIAAQVEMMRRLKDSIEKLDENTQKYSRILIWLTIILGVLAAIQIYLLVKASQF